LKPNFTDAYEEHVWDVYGFLAYRVSLRADAEDLTQLTFERAFRAWDRYDERRASVRTWLLAIAKNALTDHHRRDRSTSMKSLSEADELPVEPDLDHVRLGPDPEIARALATLSEREREVIALRFGGDLNGPEIAKLLDLSLANVQQISSRALRSLRRQLAPELASGPPARRAPPG
jgi:RNA polymerase sigma-70 factor, ECF subfamily